VSAPVARGACHQEEVQTLAALRGEMSHWVFVGIAQDLAAVSAVFRESSALFSTSDMVCEPLHHLLAATKFRRLD